MNNKSGVTMVTIVMYVVIFFALTALATGVTMAIDSNSLQDKGKIYISEAEIKIKSTLASSIRNSDSVEVINNKLVFSNNDVYYYDSSKNIIYKNDGIFIQNVTNMEFSVETVVENYVYKVRLNATIEKYGSSHLVELNLLKSEV